MTGFKRADNNYGSTRVTVYHKLHKEKLFYPVVLRKDLSIELTNQKRYLRWISRTSEGRERPTNNCDKTAIKLEPEKIKTSSDVFVIALSLLKFLFITLPHISPISFRVFSTLHNRGLIHFHYHNYLWPLLQ